MQISDNQIDEFARSWEIAFKERLARDDARTKAVELLELFSMLSTPPPGTDFSASQIEDRP
jgi:hypothetical protein